jgi:hypothetical protein
MEWKDLSMSQKSDFMKLMIDNGITNLDSIIDKYNTYVRRQDVEQSISDTYPYMYDKYPAKVIQDNTFNSGKGNIETMLGEDAYYPESNYTYKNPYPNENTIVFNDKIRDPKIAAQLDYLHVLRKEDPVYRELLDNLDKAADDTDITYWARERYEEDKRNNNGEEVMPLSRYRENEEDGWLRNMFHPGTKEEMQQDNYYPNKQEMLDYNPPLYEPTREIYNYLHPTELPEVVVNSNSFKTGGKQNKGNNLEYYAKNAANFLISPLTSPWGKYAYNFISSKVQDSFNKKGEIYDFNKVKNLHSGQNARHVYYNDFVERKSNNIRKAKDFKNTNDTLIGDHKIPLSNMPIYQGIEKGKLKVGSLKNFNDNTTVTPVRSKNHGKVKKIIRGEVITNPEYKKITDNINKRVDAKYPIEWTDYLGFGNNAKKRADRINYYNKIAKNTKFPEKQIIKKSNNGPNLLMITTNNDTIPLPTKYPKLVFGDENGDSFMLHNASALDNNQLNLLNKRLNDSPKYFVLPDNGRYGHMTYNSNVDEYVSPFDNADNMFIVGD